MGFIPPEVQKESSQQSSSAAEQNTFVPPEVNEQQQPVKKKESSISSSTAPQPASGQPSPSDLVTLQSGSPSTAVTIPSAITGMVNKIPAYNPFLSYFEYQAQVENTTNQNQLAEQQSLGTKPQKLSAVQIQARKDIGLSMPEQQVLPNGDVIVKTDSYYKNLSYNNSLALDAHDQKQREQQPGTPEYNAANFPGVALPVQKEDTTDKAKRYYTDYLKLYNPQKLADYFTAVQGQQAFEQQAEKGAAGISSEQSKIILQKTQAKFDQEALEFSGYGASSNFRGATATLSSDYKSEMDALNQLNEWPKYDINKNPLIDPQYNGQPIIQSREDALRYESLINQVKDNQEFSNLYAKAVVSKQQLDDIHKAATTYLDKYPAYKDQFNLVKQSEEYGAKTGPYSQNWLSGNVVNPAIRTVASTFTSLAYLPKAFGSGNEYGWTDALYDNASLVFDTQASVLFPESGSIQQIENPYTGEKNQIFNEDFLPGVTGAVTQMALILLGGEIPEAAGAVKGVSTLAKLSQVASATTLSMNHFYEAGKAGGMDEREAQNYSIVAGTISGAFMAVNPIGTTAAEGQAIAQKSVSEYAKALATGSSTSLARQAAVKSLVQDMAGVNMVGIAQKLSEYGTNYVANTVTGSNLDTGQNIGKDMWDTVVMSTILGAGFGAFQHGEQILSPDENQPYLEALYSAAGDPERYKNALLRMQDKGTITSDKLRYLNDQIDQATTALKTAPDALTPQQKAMLLPKLMEKQQLLAQQKTADNMLKPVVEEKIVAVDKKIRDIAGVKSEEELALEKDQEAQDLIEYQDLSLEKAALGELPQEKILRYEELSKKFVTPETAQEQAATSKTEPDATQNRIIEKNDQLQHQNGDESGQKPETSGSNRNVEGGQEQEEVIALRHGQTAEDAQNKNSGHTAAPLTDKGEEQADTKGELLKKEGIKTIITSPIERAQETAEIASKTSGATIKTNEDLKTWDIGDFSNKDAGDFDEKYYVEHPDEKVPGGESFNDFKNRMIRSYEMIKDSDPDTAIISHSRNNRAYDALEKNGGQWNDQTSKDYLASKEEEDVRIKKNVQSGNKLFNEPNPETKNIAEKYLSSKGIEAPTPNIVTSLDINNSKHIADEFQKLKNNPNDPEVKNAYEKMVQETGDQAKSIIDAGYKIEIFKGKGEPYPTSEAMIKDLKDNKHLFVLSTEKEFGEKGITNKQREENPLLRDSGIKDVNGKPLLNNDVFRFVHDFFGHSGIGNSFGPIGEENAWLIHSRMYSDEARRAMTTETRGQNSWVNFGEHMRNEDGSIKKKGEKGYLAPKNRPFAEQKMGLLPDDIVFPEHQQKSNVNRQGPSVSDLEDTEAPKEDNKEVVDRLDKDVEAMKQVSLGKIDVKRKAVEKRIDEAVKNKQLTSDTEQTYRKAINDIAEGRKKTTKESASKIIDKAADALIAFNKKLGGPDYVINPDGTKSPIVKNSILDVERLIRKTADILKAAVARGIDINIAINNMMAAIKEHPAFRRLSDDDKKMFEDRIRQEYETAATQLKDQIDEQDKREGKTVSRALESPFVDEKVKNELRRLGTDYIPVKNKIAEQDARRVVEFFKEAGETDKLESAIRDLGNGMQLGSRGAIMVELIKDYTAQTKETAAAIQAAATPEEKAAAETTHQQIANKLASIANHAGNLGTVIGSYMQYVHKALKKIFESAPDDIIRTMIDKQAEMRAKEAANSNEKNVKNMIGDVNDLVSKGNKITDQQLLDLLDKHLPRFSEENKKLITDGIKKSIEQEDKLSQSALENVYHEALKKEVLNPVTQGIVNESISKLKEYEQKISDAKSKIKAYEDATVTERKAYEDAVKLGKDLTDKEKTDLSDAVKSTREEAFAAAKAIHAFELRAQEAQENIIKKLREPRNIWNTMASMMIGNMLRIKSLDVNVLSYIPTIAMRGVGGSLGSMADWVEVKSYNAFNKFRGNEKRLERSNNILAQIEGAIKYGAGPGHQEAFRRVLTGAMSSDLGKFEGHSTLNAIDAWKDLIAKRSPAESRFIENRASAALEATLGIAPDIVFRLLQLGDAPPRKMAEAGKLFEIAKQKGLKDAEQLEFMFFPDEQSKAIAEEFGKKATYQNTNFISDRMRGALNAFSAMAEKAGNRHLAGAIRLAETTVTPFVKTPINIIGEVAMYANPAIPLTMTGIKIKKMVDASRAGHAEAANRYRGEANMYFAKAIVGMAIASIAYQFTKKGLMTPSYQQADSETEKLAHEEGIKYNSMNVSAFNRLMAGDPEWDKVQKDDYWMNYGKMGSFGMALTVWAETINDKELPKDANGLPASMAGLMVNSGLNTISTAFDQSFLTGESTLLDAMHSKNYDQIIPNTLMAFTNIALPGTLMDISKSLQENQKVTKEKGIPIDTYKNKLALGTFKGNELQDKVGLFGETLSSSPLGTTSLIYNVVDPYGFYQPGGAEVTDQIIDFYNSVEPNTEGRLKILPSVPQQTINVNGQAVTLTDQEYHDFKVMVGNARAGYVRPYLAADFQTDDYQTRVDMLNQFYRDGYKDAYWNFVQTTPRLAVIESGLPAD